MSDLVDNRLPVADAAISSGTLDRVRRLDFGKIWSLLSPAVQAEVGSLVIKQALISYAASEFEGGVVYLDTPNRDAADQEAWDVQSDRDRILWKALPEMFGLDPSPEHPDGTDPFWATPMRSEGNVVLDIEIKDDEAPASVEEAA